MIAVLAIFGPTASGKSAIAGRIAERVPARLVAADSAQLYEGLPILTNQSPAALVGIWQLDHEASVAEYQVLAHEAIDTALADGLTPIVVGGTGLYFRAALADLSVPPAPAPGARERLSALYEQEGPDQAHALLAELDPAAAGHSLRGDRLWSADTRHSTLVVGLDVPRDELDRRIEERTRAMFEAGVEEEVRRALAGAPASTAGKILGLHEVAELPRADAEREVSAQTRRLAAYQRKWMRRIPGLVT